MLLGLLAGFVPVVGMEPAGGGTPDSDHTPNSEPLPSSSGSNCSQLTLKLEFSTKVVEHGKKSLVDTVFLVCLVSCGNPVFLIFQFGLSGLPYFLVFLDYEEIVALQFIPDSSKKCR